MAPFQHRIDALYRNNLKNREFDEEAAQILESGASDIVREQGASEDPKFWPKPTTSKTDSSCCFGIKTAAPSLDVKELKGSFARVGELCGEMLELLEKLFPNTPEKNGDYALLEHAIAKEIAYIKFLKPVWDIWKHVFIRQIPKEIPAEYGIGLNQWLFIQGICNDARKI